MFLLLGHNVDGEGLEPDPNECKHLSVARAMDGATFRELGFPPPLDRLKTAHRPSSSPYDIVYDAFTFYKYAPRENINPRRK